MGSDKMDNPLLVEHEPRIVLMSEMEVMPLKYSYSRHAKPIYVLWETSSEFV
jgi:hypothetical protein